jgi:hypothetical protein
VMMATLPASRLPSAATVPPLPMKPQQAWRDILLAGYSM